MYVVASFAVTCTDAGPAAPDLCTLHALAVALTFAPCACGDPDLISCMHAWWLSLAATYMTCMVVHFHSATSTDSPLEHVVVTSAACAAWWCIFVLPQLV